MNGVAPQPVARVCQIILGEDRGAVHRLEVRKDGKHRHPRRVDQIRP
jgi:hypothetical protein